MPNLTSPKTVHNPTKKSWTIVYPKRLFADPFTKTNIKIIIKIIVNNNNFNYQTTIKEIKITRGEIKITMVIICQEETIEFIILLRKKTVMIKIVDTLTVKDSILTEKLHQDLDLWIMRMIHMKTPTLGEII